MDTIQNGYNVHLFLHKFNVIAHTCTNVPWHERARRAI